MILLLHGAIFCLLPHTFPLCYGLKQLKRTTLVFSKFINQYDIGFSIKNRFFDRSKLVLVSMKSTDEKIDTSDTEKMKPIKAIDDTSKDQEINEIVKNTDTTSNNMLILSNSPEKSQKTSPIVIGGIEISPEIIAILTVYFVQGALGLSRLAVSFFMKDELHLSPVDMATLGELS